MHSVFSQIVHMERTGGMRHEVVESNAVATAGSFVAAGVTRNASVRYKIFLGNFSRLG